MAHIDDQNDEHQRRTIGEIRLGELLPFVHHLLRGLGISVAGKVDKVLFVVNPKEVDRLRTAGRRAGTGQVLLDDRFAAFALSTPQQQRIEQARFANVAAPNEGYFGDAITRKQMGRGGTNNELDGHEISGSARQQKLPASREYNMPMTFGEVMSMLEAAGTAQNRKVYARHGVPEPMFGVSYAAQIDHEETGCKTPEAEPHIRKMLARKSST